MLTPAEVQFIEQAMDGAFDDGQDHWAYDLGQTLTGLRDNGATDTELVRVTLELVGVRMRLGLPQEEWFGEGADG